MQNELVTYQIFRVEGREEDMSKIVQDFGGRTRSTHAGHVVVDRVCHGHVHLETKINLKKKSTLA
jgi:hypothetical protein